jgi:predicted acyl esterase
VKRLLPHTIASSNSNDRAPHHARLWLFRALTVMAALSWAAPVFSPRTAAAGFAEFTRSNYTKLGYQIPMRDGAKLYTAVYTPNDG